MKIPFVLSLGSNKGDRMTLLASAVAALRAVDGLDVERVSSVYETEPWGNPQQGRFYNLVLTGATELTPEELLEQTQRIEADLGRERGPEKWQPRTIDIDIIRMGVERRDTEDLVIPHPLAEERAFVVIPWSEIDPIATEGLREGFSGDDVVLVGPLEERA